MGFMARGQRDALGRAMNGQGNHHRSGNFAETVSRSFVEMAGGAGGADVIYVLGDKKEAGITRCQREEESPPMEHGSTFGQNGKQGYAQKRARTEADKGA